jgi:hypothetical protein
MIDARMSLPSFGNSRLVEAIGAVRRGGAMNLDDEAAGGGVTSDTKDFGRFVVATESQSQEETKEGCDYQASSYGADIYGAESYGAEDAGDRRFAIERMGHDSVGRGSA